MALGALIVLVPGLGLTTAIAELATRNLVSGTARLFGAGLVFLQLVVGFALSARILPAALDPEMPPGATELPALALLPAVIGAALGAQVIFRARILDLPWVTLSVGAAMLGGSLGTAWLGSELGAVGGAFTVGLVGNLGARWMSRPAVVGILPGVLLLVPGSLGFRAFSAMLEGQPLLGVETLFAMMVTGVALVSGLFFANLLVSPRRPL